MTRLTEGQSGNAGRPDQKGEAIMASDTTTTALDTLTESTDGPIFRAVPILRPEDLQSYDAETLSVEDKNALREHVILLAERHGDVAVAEAKVADLKAAISGFDANVRQYRMALAITLSAAMRNGLWPTQSKMAGDIGLSTATVSKYVNVGRARYLGLSDAATRDLFEATFGGSNAVQSAITPGEVVKALTAKGSSPREVSTRVRQTIADAKKAGSRKARPDAPKARKNGPDETTPWGEVRKALDALSVALTSHAAALSPEQRAEVSATLTTMGEMVEP
jgi:hypothetical protein